jgi:hypothetical protein
VKETDERYTPPEILAAVLEFWPQGIGLDPCWSRESLVRARTRWTLEDDGLSEPWDGHGTIWVNPPFSNVAPWLLRCANVQGLDDEVLVICKADFTTTWAAYLWTADMVCIRSKRDQFLTPNKRLGSPTWGSVLAYWGLHVQRFRQVFTPFGKVLDLRKERT